MTQSTLHNVTRPTRGEPDWTHIHVEYIAMCDARYDCILNTTALRQFQNLHELVQTGYLAWFQRRTVVVLCHPIPSEVHGYRPSQTNDIQKTLDNLNESKLNAGRPHRTTHSLWNIMYNTFDRVAQRFSRRGSSRSMNNIERSSRSSKSKDVINLWMREMDRRHLHC